ncbi:MAG TPA: hypothetical protein VF746_03040, partial [Longimicrobium sp.]
AVSTAMRFNAEQEKRAASAPRYADRASPEFAARFVRMASLRVPVARGAARPAGGLARRPTACALTSSGDLYLGDESDRVYVWPAGGARLRALPAAPAEAPRFATALFWDEREGVLHVLDGARHQVRRYAPDGRLLGFATLNAGQATFAIALTDGGTVVAGGVRAEDAERTTLVSVHDSQGRHRAAFLDMEPAMARSKVRLAPPVLLAPAGGETFLAAQPGAPTILRMSTRGEVLQRFEATYDGYRRPAALTDATFDFERTETWRRSMDPLRFLHRGGRFVFAGFGTWRGGRMVYRLEVYGPDGSRVDTGLRHDSRPLCGRGEELVLVSMGNPEEVEVTRWRYREPAPGRAAAARRRSPQPGEGV